MVGVYLSSCLNIFSICMFYIGHKTWIQNIKQQIVWILKKKFKFFNVFSLFLYFIAWCLRSEGVSSVLLGVSNTDQLLENLGALRVEMFYFPHIYHFDSHTEPQVIQINSYVSLCAGKTDKDQQITFLTVCYPSFSQILSQMTPQTVTEIDALLGNKPHSKKESRAWRCKSEWQMMFQEERRRRQWQWETLLFALLYTQQLACPQQHYASSMCAYPFCAVHCIMYEKKEENNLNCSKRKQKQVI